jgi:hypothetical protein
LGSHKNDRKKGETICRAEVLVKVPARRSPFPRKRKRNRGDFQSGGERRSEMPRRGPGKKKPPKKKKSSKKKKK